MDLKVGRNVFNITDDDLILDNGACYQIITKKIRGGWNTYPPVMSKKLFNELKKRGFVFSSDELKASAEKRHNSCGLTYWKFDITKMEREGY